MSALELIKAKTKSKLKEAFKEVYAPPPDYTVSEFASEHRYMSTKDSPESGRWKHWWYQIDMQDVFNDLSVQICVFMTSTQIGKTAIIFNIIMYIVCVLSGGITFALPSDTYAKDYSKARLGPMIQDCPELAKKIPPGKRSGNTVLFKEWATGFLRFIGSGNADKASSFPCGFILGDEVDRFERGARSSSGQIEGTIIDLLIERFKQFQRKFLLLTSTPTVKDTSVIYEYWQRSDQRKPFVKCPFCDHEQFLAWEQFNWLGKDDKDVIADEEKIKKSFHFECEECNAEIFEDDFEEFPIPGRWVKTNPKGKFPGFHINAFYTNPWIENFEKYLNCGQNQLKLMTFWNTTLGLPFSFEAIATPDWKTLQDKEKFYHRGTVPEEVAVLLGGCDVQHDRVELTVAGVIKNQIFVIDHHVIPGNTHNADDPLWEELDDLVYRAMWDKPDGTQLKIHKIAIDSRHNANAVWRFSRTRKKVIPVTGTGVWSDKVLPAKKFEIKENGKSRRLGKHRYPLGVSLIKMDLYGRLNLPTTDGIPSEYISFPHGMSDDYYKQVCGEACELVEDSEGRQKYKWIPKYSQLEGLDCLVYAMGLHTILNMHKWSDSRWEAMGEVYSDTIPEEKQGSREASFL